MKAKIGFIGCGGIAGAHMIALARIPTVQFAAMCDIDTAKAEKAGTTYGAKPYTDYRRMLEAEKLDACFICVPPFSHDGQEELCLEKNLPFFVEKPVHLDLAKSAAIRKKVAERKLITGCGYVLRSFDVVQKAREILAGQQIGFLRGWYYGGVPGAGQGWYSVRKLSGGQLVEQSTHIVNLMQYFGGPVEEIYATMMEGINRKLYEKYDVEDASILVLKFAGGVIGNLNSTWLWSGFGSGVEIVCRGLIVTYSGNTLTVDRGSEKTTYTSSVDPMYEEDLAFINAVIKHDPAGIHSDYADGNRTLEVTLRARESFEKNTPIKLAQ